MRVCVLIFFLISTFNIFGQSPKSDRYFFTYRQDPSSSWYTNSFPARRPSDFWFEDSTEASFNIIELTKVEGFGRATTPPQWYDQNDEPSSRKGYFYNRELVKYKGELPNSFFYRDENPFRDNAMVVIIESENFYTTKRGNRFSTSTALHFKKSDKEPLAMRILFRLGCYNMENSKINVSLIFDDDPNTRLNISTKIDVEYVTEWMLIKPDDNLIKRLKKHSKVDLLIHCGENKIYRSISLKGSTKALNKILGHVQPTKKNQFEYAYNFGLANFNPFDWEGYIYKFLLDAKINHGINLDHIKKTNILTISKRLEGRTIAIALGMNDDKKVLIAIDPDMWLKASPCKRWYIIYHELGHDILNFEHGTGGPMMDPETSGRYTWSRFENDKKLMFNTYRSKK